MSPADLMIQVVAFFLLVVLTFKFFIPFALDLLFMALSVPARVISHAIHDLQRRAESSR